MYIYIKLVMHNFNFHDERKFAILIALVFLVLSLSLNVIKLNYQPLFLCISAVFLLIGIFCPKILTKPVRYWMKLGDKLNNIISPLILSMIYIFLFVPIGCIMKILNKDILKINISKVANTYWIKREQGEPAGNSLDRQF